MSKGNVLITGVSTGIGLYTAIKFANEGYTVYGSVRKESDIQKVSAQIGQAYRPLIFDVTDHQAVQAAAHQLEKEIGLQGLKLLINNSGIAVTGPLEVLGIEEYRYQFEVNVFGLIAVTKAFLPLLGAKKEATFPPGKIINMSSIAGKTCMPFMTPYSSSKAAVDRLSEGLRRELMVHGIDVVVFNPGPIETPIWEKAQEPSAAMMNSAYALSISRFYRIFLKESQKAIKVEKFADRVYRTFLKKSPKTFDIVMKSKMKNYLLPNYLLGDRLYDRLIKKILKM